MTALFPPPSLTSAAASMPRSALCSVMLFSIVSGPLSASIPSSPLWFAVLRSDRGPAGVLLVDEDSVAAVVVDGVGLDAQRGAVDDADALLGAERHQVAEHRVARAGLGEPDCGPLARRDRVVLDAVARPAEGERDAADVRGDRVAPARHWCWSGRTAKSRSRCRMRCCARPWTGWCPPAVMPARRLALTRLSSIVMPVERDGDDARPEVTDDAVRVDPATLRRHDRDPVAVAVVGDRAAYDGALGPAQDHTAGEVPGHRHASQLEALAAAAHAHLETGTVPLRTSTSRRPSPP